MKHFIYFSKKATTSGKMLSKAIGKNRLMNAGRIDIAIQSFIQAMYLSNEFRKDIIFHFLFYGMPDPPKHIEIKIKENTNISKKDIANLIKKLLYKYKKGEKREVAPGCFIEKKTLFKLIEDLDEENTIFIMDKKGEDIRDSKIPSDCVFLFGDYQGIPKKDFKKLKKYFKSISVGPKMYFASQTITIVNNELDRRGI